MNEFEFQWREKLRSEVEPELGEQKTKELLDTEFIHDPEAVEWTTHCLENLAREVGRKQLADILTRCACQVPRENLDNARATYERTGNVDAVLKVLQEQFETFLKEVLQLDDSLVRQVKEMKMGMAGERRGNTIIATKIPKSGNLKKWFAEEDPQQRAALYCHCPRVGHLAGSDHELPGVYCCCGAGFYRGMWEFILDQPVEIEVLESVLHGGERCRVAIHLPLEIHEPD